MAKNKPRIFLIFQKTLIVIAHFECLLSSEIEESQVLNQHFILSRISDIKVQKKFRKTKPCEKQILETITILFP